MIYHNDSLPPSGLADKDALVMFTTRECPITFLSSGECVAHRRRAADVLGEPTLAIEGGSALLRPPRSLDLRKLAQDHRPPGLDLDLALKSILLGPFAFSRNSLVVGSVHLGKVYSSERGWFLWLYGMQTICLTAWVPSAVSARIVSLELLRDHPELMFDPGVQVDIRPYTTERNGRLPH